MEIICYTFGVLIGFDVEKNIEEISIKKLIVSFYVEYNYCDSQRALSRKRVSVKVDFMILRVRQTLFVNIHKRTFNRYEKIEWVC